MSRGQADGAGERSADEGRRSESLLQLHERILVAANESDDLGEAVTRTLREVCEDTRLLAGRAYLVDDGGVLRATSWRYQHPDLTDVEALAPPDPDTSPDRPLLRQVLETGEPRWSEDPEAEPGTTAATAGGQTVRGVFAVPVRVGKEVVAVLEFLSPRPTDVDVEVLRAVRLLGQQLGQLAERSRAREAETRGLDAERRLLSLASHELRTPLNTILGFLDVLEARWEQLDDTTRRDFIARAGSNARRIQTLVDSFLEAVQRREEGLVPRPEPVELADEVARTLAELEPQSAERVELDAPQPATAVADRQFLHQIVVNLVSNALKHGRPPVRVGVRAGSETVVIEVCDHGDGVPEEFRPHLFTRFSRADRADDGVGLGLSIARDLARSLGGDLDYEPGPGGGACFRLTLVAA